MSDGIPVTIIYHGNCPDGFGAAWVVRKIMKDFPDVDPLMVVFHPASHYEKPPCVKGRNVLMLDFAYKKQIMEKVLTEAVNVVVIDHHKSAMEDLAEYSIEILTARNENG